MFSLYCIYLYTPIPEYVDDFITSLKAGMVSAAIFLWKSVT
jgi:hypothetical protein